MVKTEIIIPSEPVRLAVKISSTTSLLSCYPIALNYKNTGPLLQYFTECFYKAQFMLAQILESKGWFLKRQTYGGFRGWSLLTVL